MKKALKQIITATVALAMIPIVNVNRQPIADAATSGTVVILDPSDASPFNNGEFQGWGTSLCWWANRLGYSESLTQQAADAFFSEDGLGLDIARYNLGGGDDPTHNHITRSDSKVPGVWDTFELSEDGTDVSSITYDITKDQNQLNIAKAAKAANPDIYFEGFSNSAPYFMTESGCTGGATDASKDNLKSDMYDDFGNFIADATKLFKAEGIEFQSYSPMNEPDTSYWGANSVKQEGCHFDPGDSQSKAIIETRKAFDNAGLTDVLVAGMDETDIGKSVTNYGKLSDEAKTALGRIDTHTYSGSNRSGLKSTAIAANKNLWMSEVDGGWNGFGLAERIITDMNGMQPSAWVMWDIVDKHKDSSFTTPDGTKSEASATLNATDSLWGVGMADHDTETLYLANKYYFFGQFTKYINPGDTIIASSNTTLAAYNRQSGDIKIVALNSSSSDAKYEFDMSAFKTVGNTASIIRSNNSDEKWKNVGTTTVTDKKLSYTLPAQSITTFVIENNAAVTEFSADANGMTYTYNTPTAYDGYNKYFAVYDSNNTLKYISSDKETDTVSGDFSNCTFKLFVWDGMKPITDSITTTTAASAYSDEYAIIKGAGNQISPNSTVALSLSTNMEGTPVWSSSDETVATVAQDGTVTAVSTGEVTITVTIGTFTTSRTFEIPKYILTGSASWGNDSNRPADSADYTQVADGDFSTYFDGTTGGYVQYDFGEIVKATSIRLAARSGNGMPDRTVGGTIQGSYDGINWDDLYKITTAIPANEYTTISSSQLTGNTYRYFRYTNSENMANIAEFLIDTEDLTEPVATAHAVISDIAELTDNFEGNTNIFGAKSGAITDGGSVVFASGLDRYGKVFAPVKTTATASVTDDITLTNKDKFRLTFDMFAGWESGGKDNTFAIKDKDGNEIVALYMTGGGYNFNQIRIGGANVLSATTISQSRSNPGTSKAGANGWNASGQPYVNTVGYNKNVEIIIDGTGAVSISATGGMADTVVSGTIDTPVTIGSIVLTGDYNSAAERTVSYDNLDADVITYPEALSSPTPTPIPTPTPEPTDAPVLPSSGELINLNFDNGDLTSTSSYGAASGSPKFVTVDDKACIQFDGTSATVVKLTDANGNSLLTGQDELTISFKVKPTATATSWWFFAAPNDSAQTYQSEKYLGAHSNSGALNVERYNNSGSRSTMTVGTLTQNAWNDVIISVESDKTSVYVNGALAQTVDSTVSISDMLGSSSIAYIGKANWGSGEYATGYIDDFVITKGALANPLYSLDLGDLSDVTTNISLPSALSDGTAITWVSSDTTVVANDGTVTVGDETKTATLTATAGSFTRDFTVTVTGKTAVLSTFTAYGEYADVVTTSESTNPGSVVFTSEYDATSAAYNMNVELKNSENTTVGEVKSNTASGTFTNLTVGTYKITCSLTDKTSNEVKKSVTKTIKVKEEEEMSAYLFAHFVGTESSADQEQIYFSVSTDGQTWKTLNSGSPVLTSTVGEKGVRDPYILRGEDGKFFVIATDLSIYNRRSDSNRWSTCQTSGSKSIVIWESSDLVTWSEASLVQVAPDTAGCTWAPEAIYDADKGQYMVFWASKTSDDSYATQRMYRSYTSDFKTFTTPEIFIDGDTISNIDTTITSYKGVYYRFTKNESNSSVNMMKSNSLDGPWTDVSTYTLGTMTGYEGPTIYKMNNSDKWCLLLDYYSNSKGYKPFVTNDITKGTFTSAADFTFDTTYRHGTVMPITQAEYNKLIAQYPLSTN